MYHAVKEKATHIEYNTMFELNCKYIWFNFGHDYEKGEQINRLYISTRQTKI